MELEEAIKEVESLRLELGLYADKKKVKQGFAVEEVLNHLTKQEKMIDLMAYEIDRLDDGSVTYSGHENFIENIKQYFEKKAEGSK